MSVKMRITMAPKDSYIADGRLENGERVKFITMGNPVNVGDFVEAQQLAMLHGGVNHYFNVNTKGFKYYRAQITVDGKIRYMDAVGYKSKDKFAADLRGNGYKVRHIVQIDKLMEMQIETFAQGSHILY